MVDYSRCGDLSEERIDAILADSFPASDPPPWTAGRDKQSASNCVNGPTDTVNHAQPARA